MVLLIGLGSFFNLFEIALGSFLGVLLGAQWSLSTLDRSMIIGALFLGEMIGSIVLAPLADRFGRRLLFQVNLLTYAVLSLATAFAPNLGVFLVLRVVTGIGLGAELTLVDTYLSELLPRARRGRYVAWSYTLGLLAVPVAGGLAKAANTTIAGVAGWRWLLVIAASGGLAVWLLRRGLPESPRWLEPDRHRDREPSARGRPTRPVVRTAGRITRTAPYRRPAARQQVPTPDGVDVGDADRKSGRILRIRLDRADRIVGQRI
jgi:putative MFS transporter